MKSLELFAGIGGIALAESWAGIETIAFCEREPYCQKVLKKHWPDVPIFDDVKTLNKQALEEREIDVGTIELISGGFPCQPYSTAGRKKGREDDRDLWPEMFRIIREFQPTWVVGENVANFVNMELERTCTDLESEGYETQTFLIPACSVNAKHQRYRTFVIAYSNSKRCLEYEGFKKEIQQSRIEELQREKSEQSILQQSLYSSNEIVADTTSIGLQGQGEFIQSINSKKNAIRETSKFIDVRIPAEWESEPRMDRVANGIPNQMDRLRSLGNAVVPQQIYPIFKYIMEIERMNEIVK